MRIRRAAAAAALEELELEDDIVGVLTSERGIGRVASARAGTVTISAGWDAQARNTASCYLETSFDARKDW
jgi:hypothetical protein